MRSRTWKAAAPHCCCRRRSSRRSPSASRRKARLSADAAAPVFTQQATNVFRRFAVDLAKMKEFYGDVLGLKALPTLNMAGGSQMTRFHAGAPRSSSRRRRRKVRRRRVACATSPGFAC